MITPHPTLATADTAETGKTLSLVVPCYNEAGNITPFLDRLTGVMEQIAMPFEIILIDDGSRDATVKEILAYRAERLPLKLVRFSRNFGKEAALSAGLAHASGDAVIQLDADLQHPPEVIIDFVREWKKGGEIVYGARTSRDHDTLIRAFLTKSFYRIFSVISDVRLMEGLGDFLLIDRKVVNAMLSLPERERFTKGLYAWVGFERVAIPFDVAPRAHGTSGWNMFKLFHFAINAITSFGSVPLKIWTYIGLALSVSSFAYAGYIVLERLVYGTDVPGYPSLMAGICFFSGVQLLGLGIVGEYLSRVLTEVKQRPLYLVQERIGFDTESSAKPDEKPVKRAVS